MGVGPCTDVDSAEDMPGSGGGETRDAIPHTLECSEGEAGGPQGAQAQAGSGAGPRAQQPLRIHVVHVCGSAEAAAARLAAQSGAACLPQAGAARPRVAVDMSGRWATLREVGLGFNKCVLPGDVPQAAVASAPEAP